MVNTMCEIPPYISMRRKTNQIGSESSESGALMNDATEGLIKIKIGKRKPLRNSCDNQPARKGNSPRVTTADPIRSQVRSSLLKIVNNSARIALVTMARPKSRGIEVDPINRTGG